MNNTQKELCTFPYCKNFAKKRGTRGMDSLWEYALCENHKDLLNPNKKTRAQVAQKTYQLNLKLKSQGSSNDY